MERAFAVCLLAGMLVGSAAIASHNPGNSKDYRDDQWKEDIAACAEERKEWKAQFARSGATGAAAEQNRKHINYLYKRCRETADKAAKRRHHI